VRRTIRRAAGLAIIGAVLPIVAAVRAATPSRIVSTSPSITETLFALGLGDRVVGVSEYCRFPPAVLKLPKVGTFLKPDAELIAGLRPDLVVVHELSSGIDRRLAALRIPFVAVDRGTLASVFSSILQIAQAAGEPARGDTLVADIERRLQQVRRGAVDSARPRALFIIGRSPGTLTDLVAVGPGSYINDLIEIAGGRNVLAIQGQPEYPRISMETVLRLDPDVIVDNRRHGRDRGGAAAAPADQRASVERVSNADRRQEPAAPCGDDRCAGRPGTARRRRCGMGGVASA
jgi:iron complex transport system substrate-binding protein